MKKYVVMLTAIGAVSCANAQRTFPPPPPLAHDTAGAHAYSGGWSTGENGGYGFGAWSAVASYDSSTATSIVYSSVLGGMAWQVSDDNQLYGGGYANRSFSALTNGILGAGLTFTADVYQPVITSPGNNGSWGISFINAAGKSVTSFFGYYYSLYGITPTNDLFSGSSSGSLDFGISYASPTGLHLAMTITSATTFVASASYIGGGASGTVSGTFQYPGPITQVQLWTYQSGSGSPLQVRDIALSPSLPSLLGTATKGH